MQSDVQNNLRDILGLQQLRYVINMVYLSYQALSYSLSRPIRFDMFLCPREGTLRPARVQSEDAIGLVIYRLALTDIVSTDYLPRG